MVLGPGIGVEKRDVGEGPGFSVSIGQPNAAAISCSTVASGRA